MSLAKVKSDLFKKRTSYFIILYAAVVATIVLYKQILITNELNQHHATIQLIENYNKSIYIKEDSTQFSLLKNNLDSAFNLIKIQEIKEDHYLNQLDLLSSWIIFFITTLLVVFSLLSLKIFRDEISRLENNIDRLRNNIDINTSIVDERNNLIESELNRAIANIYRLFADLHGRDGFPYFKVKSTIESIYYVFKSSEYKGSLPKDAIVKSNVLLKDIVSILKQLNNDTKFIKNISKDESQKELEELLVIIYDLMRNNKTNDKLFLSLLFEINLLLLNFKQE